MGILGDYSRWDDVHVFWSEFRGFPWENEFWLLELGYLQFSGDLEQSKASVAKFIVPNSSRSSSLILGQTLWWFGKVDPAATMLQ